MGKFNNIYSGKYYNGKLIKIQFLKINNIVLPVNLFKNRVYDLTANETFVYPYQTIFINQYGLSILVNYTRIVKCIDNNVWEL